MKKIIISLLLIGLPFLSIAEESVKVVATTTLVADLVRNIGGAKVTVDSLMGAGVDPHLYKATHGDLKKLMSADVIFYNGLHLEGKMADTLSEVSKRRESVAIASVLPNELLLYPKEFAGDPDPHIWFDVSLWQRAATVVADNLSRIYPQHQNYFTTQNLLYQANLTDLHFWVQQQIALIPESQRVLITAHDAFGYFGKAYKIEVHGLQGISTVTEFGLNDLTRLVDLIVSRKIKAVFVESSVPSKNIESLQQGVLARNHEVKIGATLYSDALGAKDEPTGTYIGMVKYNVSSLVEALK